MFFIVFPAISMFFCFLCFSDVFLIYRGEINYLRNRFFGIYRNLYFALLFLVFGSLGGAFL